MKYYQDLNVGDQVTFEGSYLVTEEEIIEVGERWDPQPFHTDAAKAKDSIFGGLVAASTHIFAMFSRIGHDKIDQHNAIAAATAMGFNNLNWHRPVRPGDRIKASYEVKSMRLSKSKTDLGVVSLAHTLFNQRDEVVFTLEYCILVHKRLAVA